MDLNLSDEQKLLRESAERFVAESYDAAHRRKMANDPLGFSPARRAIVSRSVTKTNSHGQ